MVARGGKVGSRDGDLCFCHNFGGLVIGCREGRMLMVHDIRWG